MSATNGTVIFAPFKATTFALAFTNPGNLDILQVVNEGGTVVYSLDSAGVAHTNPVSPTSQALQKRLFGADFATAVGPNPASLDVLQVFAPNGGAAVFYLDSTGTAH